MSRLKIFYILSMVVLVVFISFTVFKPMAADKIYSEVQQAQFLETEDELIIQLRLFNHEGRDQNYTITIKVDDKLYQENILVRDGRMFTYIHHIYPDNVTGGNIRFAIYKEGNPTPIEEGTYYLKNTEVSG